MGSIIDLSCLACGECYSVFQGVGMRNVRNSFDHLFFNVLDEEERINLSESIPKLSGCSVESCSHSQRALICDACGRLEICTDWKIKLDNGWSYTPERRCSCGAAQHFISLHTENTINARCASCGERGLQAVPGGNWD